jgi:hypothetical protein
MDWISVKELLPKELEKVLFFWTLERNTKNISMGYLDYLGWHIYAPYDSFILSNVDITHWTQLPEYPKEDN